LNLQQVPKGSDFRHLFIAPPGETFVICDYSQYELRVLAELANDKKMRELFELRRERVENLESKLHDIGELYYTEEIGKKHSDIKQLSDELVKYDMHSQTAITLFKMNPEEIDFDGDSWKATRSKAKCINFGIPLTIAA